jgi:hypothetical protein
MHARNLKGALEERGLKDPLSLVRGFPPALRLS